MCTRTLAHTHVCVFITPLPDPHIYVYLYTTIYIWHEALKPVRHPDNSSRVAESCYCSAEPSLVIIMMAGLELCVDGGGRKAESGLLGDRGAGGWIAVILVVVEAGRIPATTVEWLAKRMPVQGEVEIY